MPLFSERGHDKEFCAAAGDQRDRCDVYYFLHCSLFFVFVLLDFCDGESIDI